jgi:peroxiredoxin Q/BCP
MIQQITDNIWLIAFIAWGLPFSVYRSRFRKIVYRTDSWVINIKPVFWKELKALFGNLYPDNKTYVKFRNFYRFYLSVYCLLFFAYLIFGTNNGGKENEMSMIEVGSRIPEFVLPDQNGTMFDSRTVVGRKNLVIYFYPKDDSPGCTREACSFRDQFEVFTRADALIIGISGQSVASHKEFAEKYKLNYTLLSDEGNTLRKRFGVAATLFGLIPGRVTYIVDKSGIVVYTFNSQSEATKHVDEAMRILGGMK